MEGLPLTTDFSVDVDLSKQICDLITEEQHERVRQKLVPIFVDFAPITFLQGLTGDPEGYDQAEEILRDWYKEQPFNVLIEDAMRLIGKTDLCYSLDSLNLQPQEQ